MLLRKTPLVPGKWLFFLVTSVCLAISACYEFIEWWAAMLGEESAEAFLGTLGDVWDTQWDLFLRERWVKKWLPFAQIKNAISDTAYNLRWSDESLNVKKCNNPFKIEELIYSPKPLELKPIETVKVVSQPRATPEGKAQADSKAQSAAGGWAFREACNPPAADHRGPGGVRKSLLYKASSLLVVGLTGIVALLFIGNFHIISDSNKGLSIVRRNSFGISEFFINADRIKDMPPVSARKRFPIGRKILQREGIIKPDEAFKRQIDTEEKKEFNTAVQDAQKEIDKMMEDAQNALKNR